MGVCDDIMKTTALKKRNAGMEVHFTHSYYNLFIYYNGLFEFITGNIYIMCEFFHCTRRLFMERFGISEC